MVEANYSEYGMQGVYLISTTSERVYFEDDEHKKEIKLFDYDGLKVFRLQGKGQLHYNATAETQIMVIKSGEYEFDINFLNDIVGYKFNDIIKALEAQTNNDVTEKLDLLLSKDGNSLASISKDVYSKLDTLRIIEIHNKNIKRTTFARWFYDYEYMSCMLRYIKKDSVTYYGSIRSKFGLFCDSKGCTASGEHPLLQAFYNYEIAPSHQRASKKQLLINEFEAHLDIIKPVDFARTVQLKEAINRIGRGIIEGINTANSLHNALDAIREIAPSWIVSLNDLLNKYDKELDEFTERDSLGFNLRDRLTNLKNLCGDIQGETGHTDWNHYVKVSCCRLIGW